jgi:hypothetical protein
MPSLMKCGTTRYHGDYSTRWQLMAGDQRRCRNPRIQIPVPALAVGSAQARAFTLREARSHQARWEQHHGPVPRLA